FIAMVLVAMIAGGVLLETTGLLQGTSSETGAQSSQRVTDRVAVQSATANYSGGSMDSIDIDVRRAPGAGDIDLSELVIHWLDSSGSTEITSTTFTITAQRGTTPVLSTDTDVFTLSDFGRTIGAGKRATLRFVTPDGGVTTVVLRAPNPAPTDGAASLLLASPTGNPSAGGSGSGGSTLLQNASIAWTNSSFSSQYPEDAVAGASNRGHVLIDELTTYASNGSELLDADDPSGTPQDIELANDVLYSAAGGYGVYAQHAGNGTTKWNTRSALDMPDVYGVIPGSSGTIYVSGGDTTSDTKDIAELNSDGSINWEVDIGGEQLPDVEYLDGAIYAVDEDLENLYRIDPADQSTTWTTDTSSFGGYNGGTPNALAADSGQIYVAMDEAVAAFHASNGTEIWNTTFSDKAKDVEVGPNGHVYYTTAPNTGHVRKLRSSNGSKLWEVDPAGDNLRGLGVASNSSIYTVGYSSSDVYYITQSE
ncbi:MAG: PQQ-binding-like beta-propeller repeat protein, partial [Salinirussus sp.]